MAEIKLDFRFSSPTMEKFFFCGKRNIAICGGFGSGKSYGCCQKITTLLTKFPRYRVAIGRRSLTDLRKTTMQTFFKVCPEQLYAEKYGGKHVEAPIPMTVLVNGSRIYWVHLDPSNETSLRSLEINSALVDQAEEVPESTYIELDNRIGRWDDVDVPEDLLKEFPNWPRNEFTQRPMAPAYHILSFNPPDEGEYSYLWQRYHPDSPQWQTSYKATHQYFQVSSRENKALPKENLSNLLTRSQSWIDRFVEGNFAQGQGALHRISPLSYLDVDQEWVNEKLLRRAVLMRVLDHGSSAPTCCTWWATLNGLHYCYREYYVADATISVHRRNIAELSGDEYYLKNLADPAIFKKGTGGEKAGQFLTIADLYSDPSDTDIPPLVWSPADNNEFTTRDRINQWLTVNPTIRHPLTGELGAPTVYFIRKTPTYPHGCDHVPRETSSQRKKLLCEINGEKVYSEEREESIADHGYDTFRYKAASHIKETVLAMPKPKPGSFKAAMDRIKAIKMLAEAPRIS